MSYLAIRVQRTAATTNFQRLLPSLPSIRNLLLPIDGQKLGMPVDLGRQVHARLYTTRCVSGNENDAPGGGGGLTGVLGGPGAISL